MRDDSLIAALHRGRPRTIAAAAELVHLAPGDVQIAVDRFRALGLLGGEGEEIAYVPPADWAADAVLRHTVAARRATLEALILAADAFHGSGILVPITNGELFRWCLEHGLHVVHTMTLMSIGLYTTPRGAYLPSVQF